MQAILKLNENVKLTQKMKKGLKGNYSMNRPDLVMMMFEGEPIETFKKLFNKGRSELKWDELLRMCYCEESYESCGGDFGDEEEPEINYERIAYLERLIAFLEQNGVSAKK